MRKLTLWSRFKLWWYDVKYTYNDDCWLSVGGSEDRYIKLTFKSKWKKQNK